MATTARMLTEEPILLTGTNAGIATLTLNRPRQYNALSEDMPVLFQLDIDMFNGPGRDRRLYRKTQAGVDRKVNVE